MTDCFDVVEINKWKTFREFIEKKFKYNRTFIFRGQRDSEWKLRTSLDRLIEKLPPAFQNEENVEWHRKRFIKRIRGKRGANPTPLNGQNEEWALGQHYGLATPLLDWSRSPYIAAFFAFASDDNPSSGKRSIYAMETKNLTEKEKEITDRINGEKGELNDNYFEKDRPPVINTVNPSLEDNPRIINQAGLFTRAPILMSIDDWIINYCKTGYKIKLFKFNLINSLREEVLGNLEYMNIHSASLFPDLHGASRYCNEFLTLRGKLFENIKKLHELE